MLESKDLQTENGSQISFTTDGIPCNDSAYNLSYFNYSSPQHELVCVFETSSDDFVASPVFQVFVHFMYSAVFIVALLGNGLVCFVVHSTPRMKTVTNYFIVNLAVGDILMTLFCVPFSFVSMLILRYWPFGAVMCKVVNFSQTVSVLVSAYTLLAISIDRYIVIMRPLKPRLSKTAAKLVVATVWVGAMITAAPIPIVSRLQRPSAWHVVCKVDVCGEQWSAPKQSEQYTCALIVLQFVLPLSALVCTYARIAHVVWGGRPPGEAQTARDSRMQSSKRKMIKMMVTVVVVFTVCWLPLNIFIVMWTAHEEDESWAAWPGMPYVWFASHWLAMSHSCYNPIIYCYMNARYRRGFKQVLSSLLCLKSNASTRQRSSNCEGIPLSEACSLDTNPPSPSWNARDRAKWRQLSRRTLALAGKTPEMVGVNGSTMPRRTLAGCKCRPTRNGGQPNGSRCSMCSTSLRQIKLIGPNTTFTPPARALSVRSHFS